MSKEEIILTVVTAALVPLAVAEFRYRTALIRRLEKTVSFIEFLKAYLLKNAVLEFHSPDPAHRRTDRIIEKLVEDKELSNNEIEALVDRIKTEALTAEDKKRRLQAASTLVIIDEFMDAVVNRKAPTALSEFE
jgi:hypothetical protein